MASTNTERTLAGDARRYLTEPAFREHPEAFYQELLAEGHVVEVGGGIWLVAGHAELSAALRDRRLSRSAREEEEVGYLNHHPDPEVNRMGKCQSGMMMMLDPPEHTRIRKLHRTPFMPPAVAAWEPYITELTAELAAAIPTDVETDLKQAFALPIPERIICSILGVPVEDHKLWEEWSDEWMKLDRTGSATEESQRPAREAFVAFGRYFADLVEKRRAEPKDDLISQLVHAEEDGDRLTDEELIGNLVLMIVAGHETTANTICSAVVLLMRHRDQWEKLVADPSLAANAVEETLRLEGAQRFMGPRNALEDIELGGKVIPAGDKVICVTQAANRDPLVFEDPLKFDITRAKIPHLGFGSGPHSCLGIHLARLQMVSAIQALVRHHPNLRLAVDASELKTTPAPTIRGWEAVPVRAS